jgi:hypothetical protein
MAAPFNGAANDVDAMLSKLHPAAVTEIASFESFVFIFPSRDAIILIAMAYRNNSGV